MKKIVESILFKRIMYSILFFYCLLFCVNQHNVYAELNWPQDHLIDTYKIEKKCTIGKKVKLRNSFNDDTLVLLKVNRKTRINFKISAKPYEFIYDDDENYIGNNYNLDYTIDGRLGFKIFPTFESEGEYVLQEDILQKESSYENNKGTIEVTKILNDGLYILDLYNTERYGSLWTDYELLLSDGTIYIQDFQIPSTMTMYYGKKGKIKLSNITPSKYDISGLKYTTSNDNVIEIDEEDGTMEAVGSGKATITVTAKNGVKKKCDVTVKNGTPKMKYKKVTIYHNYSKWLDVLNTDAKVKWTTSNKKIVTVDKSSGYIKGKKIGKATITAKVGGKTLKCKVTVKKEPVNFFIDLYGYDTRSNTFYMTIKNRAKNKLRIYSNGAYSLDKDYKSYDRNLKLTKNRKYIDIKGKKSKNVNFKVKGRSTWWDVEDAEVYFYVNFEGKKFKACGDYEDGGYYYSGGKWKETSKNKDDY